MRPGSGSLPRIGIVSSGDPKDRGFSSGIVYYTSKKLGEFCGRVEHLGPLSSPILRFGRLYSGASRLLFCKNHDFFHSVALSRSYARALIPRIAKGGYDLLFAPEASTEIAFLNIDIPIIYNSDSTFALMVDYYPFFRNLTKRSLRNGKAIERLALEKSAAVVYETQWAADSAIRDYGIDAEKVHVVPAGPNLDVDPGREAATGKRRTEACRLLFVGVEWFRKGGDIAVDACAHLKRAGFPYEFVICGCRPPVELPGLNIKVIPFLNKNDPAQNRQLMELYAWADFLLLPTRAETFGFVFCEAAAFGLPVITTATGGVPEIVLHGKTGFTLPPGSRGEEFAELIQRVFRDDQLYRSLRESAREEYEKRLNWDVWAKRMREIIHGVLEEHG